MSLALIIKQILHGLLTLHLLLYRPVFAPLPVINQAIAQSPENLTLPVKTLSAPVLPPLLASSYMIVDVESGQVLAEKDTDVALFPASTTKVMTAVVVLESMNLDSVITVPPQFGHDGSVMKLVPGEQMTVRDMLTGMLVHSSNDAANVFALVYPGGESAFVAAMNAKAAALHMTHTRYMNPSGLIDPNHVMSVRDLLILSRYAMHNPVFASIVKQPEATLHSIDGRLTHHVVSTNALLGKLDGIEGIKTGWTQEAGECFVAQVTRDGHTIMTAVLHSPDRFAETTTLVNWAYNSYRWETKPTNEWLQNAK